MGSEMTADQPHQLRITTIIACGLLALLCVLPFLIPHHRIPLTTFYNQWSAIALSALLLIVLFRRQRWQPVEIPWLAFLPIGLLIIVLIQQQLGLFSYWQHSFMVGMYLLWTSLLIIVGAQLKQLITLEKLIPVLAWSLLVGGFLSAIIVVMQYLGLDAATLILRHRSGGFAANLGQVNHLATYLGLALGSVLYLYLSRRINTGSVLISSSVLLIMLALTGQRMGWLYVVLLAVGGWLIARKADNTDTRKLAGKLLWLIPLFAVIQLLLPLLGAAVPDMPAQRVVDGMQGTSIRLQLLQQAWEMFTNNPLLGVGWGQFGWHNFAMTESYPELNGYANHAHNLPLQLLAEAGIFAGLLLIVATLFWFWQQRDKTISAERWWLYAVLSVLAIHSLLEYPLWYAYFLAIAAIVIGISAEKGLRIHFSLGGVLAGALLIFSGFMLTNIAQQYHQVESWYTKGRQGGFSDEQAIPLLYEMAEARDKSLFAPYLDLVIIRALPNTAEVLPDKLAMNTQLMHYIPGEEEVYSQVTLLALSDQPEQASRQLDLAMRHYPKYMDRYWKTATRGLLVGGHQQLFPLIQQLQDYQDASYPLEP